MEASIRCNFCHGPAHPATGCVYGARTIACMACTRDFWKWAIAHTNGKARKSKSGVLPSKSFYEAAACRG